jgi:hypothetical protein
MTIYFFLMTYFQLGFLGYKCLLCGEIVDEVIMEERNGFRRMMGNGNGGEGKIK